MIFLVKNPVALGTNSYSIGGEAWQRAIQASGGNADISDVSILVIT